MLQCVYKCAFAYACFCPRQSSVRAVCVYVWVHISQSTKFCPARHSPDSSVEYQMCLSKARVASLAAAFELRSVALSACPAKLIFLVKEAMCCVSDINGLVDHSLTLPRFAPIAPLCTGSSEPIQLPGERLYKGCLHLSGLAERVRVGSWSGSITLNDRARGAGSHKNG